MGGVCLSRQCFEIEPPLPPTLRGEMSLCSLLPMVCAFHMAPRGGGKVPRSLNFVRGHLFVTLLVKSRLHLGFAAGVKRSDHRLLRHFEFWASQIRVLELFEFA